MARIALFVFSAIALAGIGVFLSSCEMATVSAQAGYGASPTLPAPNPGLIPKVNIAPAVGWPEGVLCSKNNLHEVHDKIGSASTVLFDTVAILPGQNSLATTPAALSFLTEAFQHCKYIGWSEGASALVAVCALSGAADDAFCALTDTASVTSFVMACKTLRHWPREILFMP